MSTLEKILLAILTGAETIGPIFVHSSKGVAVFNASEEFVGALATSFAPKTTGTVTPTA